MRVCSEIERPAPAPGKIRVILTEALSHLVFADPDNGDAKALLADTFEQLGYLSESATWRNAYLFAAQELRHGMPKLPPRAAMPRETLGRCARSSYGTCSASA